MAALSVWSAAVGAHTFLPERQLSVCVQPSRTLPRWQHCRSGLPLSELRSQFCRSATYTVRAAVEASDRRVLGGAGEQSRAHCIGRPFRRRMRMFSTYKWSIKHSWIVIN